ncbi:ImmA/IrrE family metallo-endopeptidase [Clostridium uliginosum]|uniref:IrrE N-terminal-like domain-containing protein n=1 Tax=Clostridium uliginosum TaxID=119641 RepID=A0A1I1NQ59_9CLOT|nr:ImmA/IrrE family metallo-endopeptidase [Clostridium uliginosum]SFC99412.1 protein of unknown function [Clostridium uliginosum]
MNKFEILLQETERYNISVKEKNLQSKAKGLCKGNKIAINNKLKTISEKSCVLAEELGHYHRTVGNITDQTNIKNRKQEIKARRWGYEKLVGLVNIINAFEYGAHTLFEMTEYLEVTEEFLNNSLNYYRKKYGISCEIDSYIIYFEPNLSILKLLQAKD